MSQQPTIAWFVKRALYLVLFWIVAVALLLYLAGVQVNWRNRQLVPSASIALSSSQQKKLAVRYTLNGESADIVFPTTIDHLNPGTYTLELAAPGKQTWRQTMQLDAYEAAVFDSVLLVPITLTPRPATAQENQALERVKHYVSKGLLIRDTELLDIRTEPEVLVTRLSVPIEQAVWTPDREHIVVRAGNDIMLMDSNGTNITPLFSITEDHLVPILMWDHGRIIVIGLDTGAVSYELY